MKFYHTVFGEAETCDKIIDGMIEYGWRVHTFNFVAMNEVECEDPTDPKKKITMHIPCFAYLLEHQSIHQAAQQSEPAAPPRKFIGMKS